MFSRLINDVIVQPVVYSIVDLGFVHSNYLYPRLHTSTICNKALKITRRIAAEFCFSSWLKALCIVLCSYWSIRSILEQYGIRTMLMVLVNFERVKRHF